MSEQTAIKLFETKKVRTAWDENEEEWYFSIVDVVGVLTESANSRRYWSDLKIKLKKEGSQLYENFVQLKMPSEDGKSYLTDVANTEQLFRLIQSIPSPKAEPFKQWLAQVAKERLDQLQDPELSIEQAMIDYKRLGYSDIAQRGGNIAKETRLKLEAETGKKVVTPLNAKNVLQIENK
jgi:prophage antirepressor-like protein